MTDWIFGVIGTILYPLFSIIFLFVDALQSVFRIFAGVGAVKITDGGNFNLSETIGAGNSGRTNDTGLIFYFLNTPLVKNMLMSIMLLAMFLIIIFTVMAFIKNAYAAKQKGWKEIVGNAIKGLANFIFIPVCCLLGVWLGNILLNAIDGATSSGGSTQMSRKLFITCAYNANVFRAHEGDENGELNPNKYLKFAELYNEYVEPNAFDTSSKEKAAAAVKARFSKDQIAQQIDNIYAAKSSVTKIDADGNVVVENVDAPSIHWYWQVWDLYNLWEINYLTLVVGGVFMLYVLVGLTYGMVRRLFILLMLFIISPGIAAMYPLDDGSALGGWKKKFIGETISAYGAVAGMNLFFSILPLIDRIEVATGFLAPIIQLLVMVSGLFVVKEIIGMISGFIGAEDAYSKGTSLRGQTTKAAKDWGKKAVTKGAKYAFSAHNAAKDSTGFWHKVGAGLKGVGKEGFHDATGLLGFDSRNASGLKDMLLNSKWMEDVKEGKKQAREGEMQAIKARGLKLISEMADEAASTSDPTERAKKIKEVLDRAKKSGVEKEIAQIVADQLNEQEVTKAKRDRTYVMKINTADSLLEDIKKVGTAASALDEVRKAQSRMVDESDILSASGATAAATTLGLTTNPSERAKRMRDGYTDNEIEEQRLAGHTAEADAMIAINRAAEEAKERRSEYRSALSALDSAAVDTTSLTYSGFAPLKKDEIKAAILEARDGGDLTGAKFTALISSLDGLKVVVDNINSSRVETVRDRMGDIRRASGNTGEKKK